MKKIVAVPKLLIYLDKSDPKNSIGFQLRIWSISNKTEIFIRLENQNNEEKKLWDGKRTNGDIVEIILDFIYNLKVINNKENWNYSADHVMHLKCMDEYEDKDHCLYFAFFVKPELIKF